MDAKRIFALVLGFFIVAAAFSQAAATGEIEYMEGSDLSLIRKGLQVRIQEPIGMKLYEGDFLNTGSRTYLEIKTLPKGDILKVAENTSLRLSKMVSAGESSFQLLYGRIRAKVGKLAGTESFTIRSSSTAAGVRGTDFGYDLITSKGKTGSPEPVIQVYCFEGTVEVTTLKTLAPSTTSSEKLEPIPETILLRQDEMVTIQKNADTQEIKKQAVKEEIKTYWKSVEPQVSPKAEETLPVVEPEPGAVEKAVEAKPVEPKPADKAREPFQALPVEPVSQVDFSKMMDALEMKNATIWTGILFTTLGVGAQAYATYNTYTKGNASLTTILQIAGTALGACGLVSEFVSVFINPVFPEKAKQGTGQAK